MHSKGKYQQNKKTTYRMGEHIHPHTDKVIISRIIKNLQNSTPKRQTTQLKNGQKTWTDSSLRKTYRGPRDIGKDAQHH